MKNRMTKIGLSAAVVMLAAIAAQPVQAACAFPGILATTESASAASQIMTQEFFDSSSPSPYGYPGAFYSYAGPPLDVASLQGIWWAIGTGNPATGAGDDNGSFDPTRWIQIYSFDAGYGPGWYGAYFSTGWGATAEVDGCINNNTTGCTCVMLTTNAPAEGPKFLLLGASHNTNFDHFFVNPGNAPFIMGDFPTAFIQSSSADVDLNLTLDVALSDTTSGVYEADGCDCNLAYRIREIIQTRGLAPPMDRDVASWGGEGNPVVGSDGPTSILSTCGSTDTDVYLATELVADPASNGGFGSPVVSANSTRLECGPTVANPTPIKERPVPVQRPQPRGGRSGR